MQMVQNGFDCGDKIGSAIHVQSGGCAGDHLKCPAKNWEAVSYADLSVADIEFGERAHEERKY